MPVALKAQTTSPQAQIQQLEQSLRANPGVFDWNAHNELRHLYSTKTPPNLRNAMEHADIILQYSPMDDYILHILSDWQLDKNTATARANLLSKARSFPDLRFLGAAVFLKIGDLYAKGNDAGMAKSFYLKVADDTSSDMTQYHVLAEERLRQLPEERALQMPTQGHAIAKYVALGDSYSSGEGAVDSSGKVEFIQGTDTAKSNECHRSMHAYPERVKTDFGVMDFIFRACSGAIEAEFYRKWSDGTGGPVVGQWTDDPAQLDVLTPDVDLVTLSIGGNDSGFAQVLDFCVDGFLHWKDEATCLSVMDGYAAFGRSLLENGLTIKVFPSKDFPGTTWSICNAQCVTTSPGQTITLPGLSAPGGLFQEIHTRAPNTKIRVLLYPRLFPTQIVSPLRSPGGSSGNCIVGSTPQYSLTPQIIKRLNTVTDNLNAVIVTEINKAREAGMDIKDADPNIRFEGHRLCDTKDPWINGIWYTPRVFSFHPNAVGQSQLAEVIKEKL